MWLKSRALDNRDAVEEKQGFVVVNEDLEKEFDAFKAELSDDAYLPESKLILFWYQKTYNSTCRIV